MEATDNVLKLVQEYAEAFFSPEEIATIMDVHQDEMKHEMMRKDLIYSAYYKGRLLSEAKVRKAIIDLAAKGSSPAQTLAIELIKQAKLNEVSL